MTNPKTTIWGILILTGSVLILGGHALPPLLHGDMGGVFSAFTTYWPAVLAAFGGAGFIASKDGGA